MSRWRWAAVSGAFAVASILLACASAGTGDGLDAATLATMAPDVQSDYAVFAQRCSKCHSLSRPLQSGITEDAFWVAYVAKMRRQPGSGISRADATPILRFLHYYSAKQSGHDEGKEGGP